MVMLLNEFEYKVLKRDKNREHKIKGSQGVKQALAYYRKHKPKGHEYVLTDSQYYSIIRGINKELSDRLAKGGDIKFLHNMGKLQLRKYSPKVQIKNGKLKVGYSVDWKGTLKLWYTDKESYENRTLIRKPEKEIFRIIYTKNSAKYSNKTFYSFQVNRELKNKLKHNIQEGIVDAFNF